MPCDRLYRCSPCHLLIPLSSAFNTFAAPTLTVRGADDAVLVPTGSSFCGMVTEYTSLVPTRRLCITATSQILPSNRIQAIFSLSSISPTNLVLRFPPSPLKISLFPLIICHPLSHYHLPGMPHRARHRDFLGRQS